MDITSKEFPGKLIAWAVMIGAAIIFYDVFIDMAYDSLLACEMVEESLDKIFSFWEGEYYGTEDSWLSRLGRTNI